MDFTVKHNTYHVFIERNTLRMFDPEFSLILGYINSPF